MTPEPASKPVTVRSILVVLGALAAWSGPRELLAQPGPADPPPAEPAPPAPPSEAIEAQAEEPPPDLPPPPPPRAAGNGANQASGPVIQLETPPPAPAQRRRGFHVHDGFYLRFGLGIGSGQASVSTDSSSSPDYDLAGGSGLFQAWVGGSPARGFAVGGGLLVGSLGADRLEVGNRDVVVDTSGRYGLLGAFVDGFPNPSSGFHVGGSLALAGIQLDVSDTTAVSDFDGGGVGFSAWVGYDAWISPEWSLGGLLQLSAAFARDEESSLVKQASAGGVSLSFTALYH